MNSATLQAPSQSVPTGAPTPSQAKRAKDQAARNRSSQVRSSIPADAKSTPGAMKTHQERDPAVAARRSPGEANIDYGAVILEVAHVVNKANGVKRIASHKAKQHVFVLACKEVKSILGLGAKDDKGNPTRLSDEHEQGLRRALENLHNCKLEQMKTYGGDATVSDFQIREDVPVVKVVPMLKANGDPVLNEAGEPKFDVDFREKMVATVSRPVTMLSKQALNLSFKVTAAQTKLDHMKSRLDRYDGVDIRKQEKLLTILESKQMEITIEKGRLAKIAQGVQALDNLLAVKKITQEEYAQKRTEIETTA